MKYCSQPKSLYIRPLGCAQYRLLTFWMKHSINEQIQHLHKNAYTLICKLVLLIETQFISYSYPSSVYEQQAAQTGTANTLSLFNRLLDS